MMARVLGKAIPTAAGLGRLLLALAVLAMAPAVGYASPESGTPELQSVGHPPENPGAFTGHWEAAEDIQDGCPHCLPNHCAVAPACNGSLAGVKVVTSQQAPTAPTAGGPPVLQSVLPRGLERQPPTPPPQYSV